MHGLPPWCPTVQEESSAKKITDLLRVIPIMNTNDPGGCLLTFYLAKLLTFCLANLLTFYLTSLLMTLQKAKKMVSRPLRDANDALPGVIYTTCITKPLFWCFLDAFLTTLFFALPHQAQGSTSKIYPSDHPPIFTSFTLRTQALPTGWLS